MRYLMIAVVMLLVCSAGANAAVLVQMPNGTTVTKTSLAVAATAADVVGKTVIVNSPQVVTTAIAWPSDRELKFEKGGYVTFSGAGALTGLKEARPEWFGAKGDGSTDDATAIQRAVNSASRVAFDSKTYVTGTMIDAIPGGARRELIGSTATVIKKASSFTGTCLLSLGNRLQGRANSNWGTVVENIDFDLNGGSIPAIETYGLLGKSTIKNVLITNFTGTALRTYPSGFRSDEAGYLASPLQNVNMNESLVLDHVIAQSDLAITGGAAVFEIDSCFETTLIACRAFGKTTVDSQAVGFRIGHNFSSWGVNLYSCTANNFKNSNTAIKSYGIHYSKYARDCHDIDTNFEAITGSAVLFSGSTLSGTNYPSACSTTSPRLYNNNNADELNPAIQFYDYASFSAVRGIHGYNSSKVWVSFDASNASFAPSGCSASSMVTSKAIADLDDIFTITTNADDAGNSIDGFSTTAKQNFMIGDENGTAAGITGGINLGTAAIYTDGNYTNIKLDATNKLRFRDSAAAVKLNYNDGVSSAFQFTAPLFMSSAAWDGGALISLGSYRLWVDATGALRIKNGAPTSDLDGTKVGAQ